MYFEDDGSMRFMVESRLSLSSVSVQRGWGGFIEQQGSEKCSPQFLKISFW